MKDKEKGFDFQRHIDRHLMAYNRVKFVSNHFNDVRTNRVFRVDPVVRCNVRTLADTGGARARMTLVIASPKTAVDFTFVESKKREVFSEWGIVGDAADGNGFPSVRLSDTHWGFRGRYDDYVRFPRTMKYMAPIMTTAKTT